MNSLDLTLVCDGLKFPEGPVWMLDGSLLVGEIEARRVSRIAPDGTRTTVAELPGGANGLAIGPDGALYVCDNGGMAFVTLPDGGSAPVGAAEDHAGGAIRRVDLDTGEVTTLYTECDGRPLNSPNDLVFDRFGGFWFTDLGRTLATSHDVGSFHYARADGSGIRLAKTGMHSPNGIGLSPDGARVHVAETITGRLWSHDVVAPGEIAPPTGLWNASGVRGPLPGYQLFDSLAVEADGRVCVATLVSGGVSSFADDGIHEFYKVPDFATTNLCFGGEDMRDVWITASSTGRLYRARWPRPGLRLAHYR